MFYSHEGMFVLRFLGFLDMVWGGAWGFGMEV